MRPRNAKPSLIIRSSELLYTLVFGRRRLTVPLLHAITVRRLQALARINDILNIDLQYSQRIHHCTLTIAASAIQKR